MLNRFRKMKVRNRSESVSHDRTKDCVVELPVYRRMMHRRLSDFSDIQHLTEDRKGLQLNERQKFLIKKAWKQVVKRGDPGKWIVRELFTRYAEIRNIFGVSESSLNQLDSHPTFIRHSKLFQNLLEMIIDSLDALDDQLGSLLASYGCRHVAFERQFGFHQDLWRNFSDVMCELADSWRLTAHCGETLMAWRLLVLFVVDKCHRGFEAEKRRLADLELND